MPITFIGSDKNNSGNTISIPAHQTGDMIIVSAHSSDPSYPIATPAGWTDIASLNGFGYGSFKTFWKLTQFKWCTS
jgi:hypothetical protein